ncbi:hypothetical protein HJC23_002810 [Cyclotella cryptica]|uniref:Uncharacterized protein n=1 Tax=Cyclotella cryptica TaxID=29204 RepID=A0ABD3PSP2_9STRA|eukprot:CCRYP_013084-RA/>CCRYP_013084-RA protein AED:0.38 eAED:0.38 QI:0/-1/0/1/-1/1/1/0/430
MADSEPLLRSLGITLKSPFRWGDEIRANLDPIPNAPEPARSGLDSIIRFVQENDPSTTDGTDNKVKQAIASLLKEANVPLSNPEPYSVTEKPNRKRYFELLEGDGELGSRDVSIRGLSDRACAELTVESRSSLFGSILRLFDMDRVEEKVGTSDVEKAEATDSSAPEINPVASCSDASETVGSEENVANKNGHAITETESITAAANESTEAGGTSTAASTPDRDLNQLIAPAPILSTAEIVRSCHLTARPGCIPPGMDSKEYTMAALHFLSSHVPYLSEKDERYTHESLEGWQLVKDTFPILPLLMATNPEESLEKRSYGRMRPLIGLGQSERKQYPDSMDSDPDFRRKVLNLERAFSSSLPFSPTTHNRSKSATANRDEYVPFAFQRYFPRRKLCPRIETEGVKEELTLMISGHVQQDHPPQSASAKSK